MWFSLIQMETPFVLFKCAFENTRSTWSERFGAISFNTPSIHFDRKWGSTLFDGFWWRLAFVLSFSIQRVASDSADRLKSITQSIRFVGHRLWRDNQTCHARGDDLRKMRLFKRSLRKSQTEFEPGDTPTQLVRFIHIHCH